MNRKQLFVTLPTFADARARPPADPHDIGRLKAIATDHRETGAWTYKSETGGFAMNTMNTSNRYLVAVRGATLICLAALGAGCASYSTPMSDAVAGRAAVTSSDIRPWSCEWVIRGKYTAQKCSRKPAAELRNAVVTTP